MSDNELPRLFVAYEIKPCVQWRKSVESFPTLAAAEAAIAREGTHDDGEPVESVFWTLYGRQAPGDDGIQLADAIGDVISEADARRLAYQITRDKGWLGEPGGNALWRDVEPDRTPTLVAALQWLLDDMESAEEIGTFKTDGRLTSIFDSVESAAAALVEAGGSLSWFTVEQAAEYRARMAAKAD